MDISVKYNGPELAGEFSAARIGIAHVIYAAATLAR
jgi:hypothetical protein